MAPVTRPTKKTWTVGDKVYALRDIRSGEGGDEDCSSIGVVIPGGHIGKIEGATKQEATVLWDGPVEVRSTHLLDNAGRADAFERSFDPADVGPSERPPAPSDSRASKHWLRVIALPTRTDAGPVEGYITRLEPHEARRCQWAFIRANSPQEAEALTAGEPECLEEVVLPGSILIAPFPDYVMGLWSKHIARELSVAELEGVVAEEGALLDAFDHPTRRNKGTRQSITLAKTELKRREKEARHAAP